jgi:type IV fimbrial biogenesis protein FimT
MRVNQIGFTLWELLVAMLVVGIVLGFGVPNFMTFTRNGDMAAAVNTLVSSLHLSRSEAVKRQRPVTVCGSSNPLVANPPCDGGTGGFFAFVDLDDTNGDGVPDGDGVHDAGEPIVLQRARPADAIDTFVAGGVSVTYQENGFIDAALAPITVVLYCDERGNRDAGNGDSTARAVRIARTGRPTLQQTVGEIAAAVADTGGVCP